MAINSIQNSERSCRLKKKNNKSIHLVCLFTHKNISCITRAVIWGVTANQWGRVTEFDFPQALCKAQFMDGSMPRLGKLCKENVPALPAALGAWQAHPLAVTVSTAVITAITGFALAHTPCKKTLMISGF